MSRLFQKNLSDDIRVLFCGLLHILVGVSFAKEAESMDTTPTTHTSEDVDDLIFQDRWLTSDR